MFWIWQQTAVAAALEFIYLCAFVSECLFRQKILAGEAECVRSSSSVFVERIMRDKRATLRQRESPFTNSRWVSSSSSWLCAVVQRFHPACPTVPAPPGSGGANPVVPRHSVGPHTPLPPCQPRCSAAASVALLGCRLAFCRQLPRSAAASACRAAKDSADRIHLLL